MCLSSVVVNWEHTAHYEAHVQKAVKNSAHVHTQPMGQFEEVRFQRKCVPDETVPGRWCSIRKRFLTKRVHAYRGKIKNRSVRSVAGV